jgi:hypothetical protein
MCLGSGEVQDWHAVTSLLDAFYHKYLKAESDKHPVGTILLLSCRC